MARRARADALWNRELGLGPPTGAKGVARMYDAEDRVIVEIRERSWPKNALTT
jgi:hypothetical protein